MQFSQCSSNHHPSTSAGQGTIFVTRATHAENQAALMLAPRATAVAPVARHMTTDTCTRTARQAQRSDRAENQHGPTCCNSQQRARVQDGAGGRSRGRQDGTLGTADSRSIPCAQIHLLHWYALLEWVVLPDKQAHAVSPAGMEFGIKRLPVGNDMVAKIQLWDTAGACCMSRV